MQHNDTPIVSRNDTGPGCTIFTMFVYEGLSLMTFAFNLGIYSTAQDGIVSVIQCYHHSREKDGCQP